MSKRRKKHNSRADIIFKLLVVISLLISFSVGTAISFAITNRFDGTVFVITFFISLITLATLVLFFSIPFIRGSLGERIVSHRFKPIIEQYGGYIIDNIIIPNGNKSAQIDHILVATYGLFVIETKNYTGHIYGNEEDQKWTQVLAYGNVKNKLYNPIKQNKTHVIALKKELCIDDIYVDSIVVFTKANLSNVIGKNVFGIKAAKEYIVSKVENKKISSERVKEIYDKINEYKTNPKISKKEHLNKIRENREKIKNNICPRCGGNLVLRTSKSGSEFYGCSNFPRCKFTKEKGK